ncbi:hypothetical protein [Paraburkholderia sp. WC7.3d]
MPPGLKDGGSKQQLAQRLIGRLAEEGARVALAEHWPHVFELADELVPDHSMLSSAWRWFTKYAEVFVEALGRKRYEIDSSKLRSVGFLKLDTLRCAKSCSRPKFKGAYPKLHGVPPYDLLCECSAEVDNDRLYAAMAEEREKRRVESAGSTPQTIADETIWTDFTNLINDLTDAFRRIDSVDRVACLIEPATSWRDAGGHREAVGSKGCESGEPTHYRFCVTLYRTEGSSVRLEVYDARDEGEASSGIPRVLAEQGWTRPEEQEEGYGAVCWENRFDVELSARDAAAACRPLWANHITTR